MEPAMMLDKEDFGVLFWWDKGRSHQNQEGDKNLIVKKHNMWKTSNENNSAYSAAVNSL